MNDEVRIERGVPAQAEAMSEVARRAKAGWGYPAHWMKMWRGVLTMRPKRVAKEPFFVALRKDEVVGFASLIIDEDGEWRLEHLWVLPQWQGRRVGSRLLLAAATHARHNGGRELVIQSDPNAAGFYLRAGAVRSGANVIFFDGADRTLPQFRYGLV